MALGHFGRHHARVVRGIDRNSPYVPYGKLGACVSVARGVISLSRAVYSCRALASGQSGLDRVDCAAESADAQPEAAVHGRSDRKAR